MSQLTIVANITANPDKIDFVKEHLECLISKTRAEEGCILYDLHQDNENPAHFMFYETWESRDLWQNHINSQHIQEYRTATEGSIAGATIFEMSRVA